MESGRLAVRIEEVTSVDPELVASLRGLVAQLSTSALPPTDEHLQEILDSPATRLLVARGDDGARAVHLTSRPDRAAANRLYQRLGFEPRGTNVYRLELR